MAAVEGLIRRRKLIQSKVEKLIATLEKHEVTPVSLEYAEIAAETFEYEQGRYEAAQEQILAVQTDQRTLADQELIGESFDSMFIKARAAARRLVRLLTPPPPNVPVQPKPELTNPTADIKLPRMELPTFSGNYTDWSSFRDLFSSIVHNNTRISGSQKLHYLKNSLQGDAADLVKSIDITDANYDRAWKLLGERYNNKRQIVHSHFRALLKQEHLRQESAVGLRRLLDTTTKHIDAIEALGGDEDRFEQLLIILMVDRLDGESRKQWELHSPGPDLPDLEELNKFLDQRARALEACESTPAPRVHKPPVPSFQQHHHQQKPRFQPKQGGSSTSHVAGGNAKCPVCGEGAHPIYKCGTFNKLTANERTDVVRQHNLCFNCLGSGHSAGSCTSSSTCKKCNAKHHTMIHWDKQPKDDAKQPPAINNSTNTAAVSSNFGSVVRRSLLSTAVVKVNDAAGRPFTCRVLLDNGSELSFVTEAMTQLLGLKRKKTELTVTGIGGEVAGLSRGMVKLQVQSTLSEYKFTCDLHVLQKLTGYQPQLSFNGEWEHLRDYDLADPNFRCPGRIDILLGADVYFDLLCDRTIAFPGFPHIYETHLGWIVSGCMRRGHGERTAHTHLGAVDVQAQLAKFWELEELNNEPLLTPDEVACENHFATTHGRDNEGRYVVALPFKESGWELGASKEQAIRRLHQVERRLARFPQHRAAYNQFMAEFEELGHMQLIPQEHRAEAVGRCFYLPHHFVTKESSTTTKLRVVFDGSAKTSSNVSLNDTLHIGPRLQREIFGILLRFLFFRYVFTADISKFFRQVGVRSEDRDFQRILWRPDTHRPIEEYWLTTVTYGTAPAPYLASRALLQLADDHGAQFALASKVVKTDFYVDDVMSGAHTVSGVLQLQAQLVQLLQLGQFPLVKWVSNCPAVLEAVPPEHRETRLPLLLDSDDSVKALGLYWNPAADQFFFKVNLEAQPKKTTKRSLLSDTAKLFDPLGWLAPVIVKAKILFQGLWRQQLGWDDELPPQLRDKWLGIRGDLFNLQELRLDRHVIDDPDAIHQLHGFCDASEQAYSAAVYVRSISAGGQVKTRLLCAKTKVAPVKVVSIPRLELCGAVLLAKLLTRVAAVVNVNVASTHAWIDSTVVLDWLGELPCTWETFVANRVSEIQGRFARDHWRHVPTKENPADCASRGISALELLNFDLWWLGPHWLGKSEEQWPSAYRRPTSSVLMPEAKRTMALTTAVEFNLVPLYSSLHKLKCVTAHCFRFAHNCRKFNERRRGPLTPQELDDALTHWVRFVQAQEFGMALALLRDGKPAPLNLASLAPFIDGAGILRVGGRLAHSSLAYAHKHPALLPVKHQFTDLVIRSEHHRLLHGGGQVVLASLSKQFWIVNARKAIGKVIRGCMTCFRFNADALSQLMGNLPSTRLEPARPFLRTGVDFGGPFTLKTWKGRGAKTFKAYIALFVCFVTKAVHIELVTDLTTEGFLAAFRRFVARRGRPLEVSSDNGTNFVGANNELHALHDAFCSQQHNEDVQAQLAKEGTTWRFIPARSPHCGGLWEAGIKSAKHHMRRVIGERPMTYEEMLTTLVQIEACLNSRPLTPMSADPNDMRALTAGHFLIGEELTSVPEPDLTRLPENRLSRFQLLQQQFQHFWRRWQLEYLQTLQQRTKWAQPGDNIEDGDMVLVKEDNLPPLKWSLARVVQKHPGSDGLTRVVTIRTPTGNLKRDIRKLCRLPIESVEGDASRVGGCSGAAPLLQK